VDVHKAANIWPLLGNLLPAEKIEPQVFAEIPGGSRESAPEPSAPKRRGRNTPGKAREED
jgi:hypothetical protein